MSKDNDNNILDFPQDKCHQTEVIQGLKNIGYTDNEVQDALLFIDNNPLNNDMSNVIPFPTPEPMGVVIPFRRK